MSFPLICHCVHFYSIKEIFWRCIFILYIYKNFYHLNFFLYFITVFYMNRIFIHYVRTHLEPLGGFEPPLPVYKTGLLTIDTTKAKLVDYAGFEPVFSRKIFRHTTPNIDAALNPNWPSQEKSRGFWKKVRTTPFFSQNIYIVFKLMN